MILLNGDSTRNIADDILDYCLIVKRNDRRQVNSELRLIMDQNENINENAIVAKTWRKNNNF